MPFEIERKFLVTNTDFLKNYTPTKIVQGYLSKSDKLSFRIRIANSSGFITIKSKRDGIVRSEYEYEIPLEHAKELLKDYTDNRKIEKDRYNVPYKGKTIEVDVFKGNNDGLIIAEIELNSENEQIELPDWIGKEVSSEIKYYNSQLVNHPYSTW